MCRLSAKRDNATRFSVNSQQDSRVHTPHSEKEIDKAVGKDADEKWNIHEQRVRERREKAGYKIIDLGVQEGGKFDPQVLMGNAEKKELARQNSEAFKRHQQEKKEASKG